VRLFSFSQALKHRFQHLTLACALLALLIFAAPALAADGGAGPGSTAPTGNAGGSGQSKTPKKKAKTKKKAVPPVLAGFSLSNVALSSGRSLTVRYRVTGSAKQVRVKAVVRTRGNKYVRSVDLGLHSTNALVTSAVSINEMNISRTGRYKLRISARDSRGRVAKRAKGVPLWRNFSFSVYRFPVDGAFNFGGDGARFGSGRPGHIHQGQDIVADEGLKVVAPYSGTVTWTAYQADGAGYYVVLDSDDGRDYVFMHLQKGSTVVKNGQRVVTGQKLGLVGSTGASSGPHLHFEIWTGGPWQFGGRPIDPLPTLKAWAAANS
jgi:murein DD-endopeptidase MepM/ murein hydrolase activator NlpD